MTPAEVVELKLVPHARRICGLRLADVRYAVLAGEATKNEIHADRFYFGGECRLEFSRTERLYVSWDRVAQWPDDTHFSLSLSQGTLFSSDSLTTLSANNASIWSPHIGGHIDEVKLLGMNGVPFVLALKTESGSVFLGSSSQTSFGDGDDILVTTDSKAVSSMSTIWQSESA